MVEEYIGKYKKALKPTSFGKFEADVVNKVSSYCTLTKENRIDFITDLIERELEDKILTNNVITLPKPCYFNIRELKEKRVVKASYNKPIHELENNTYIFFNVPNNLDRWNEEFRTYCYEDNKYLHEGYYKARRLDLELVFRYNSDAKEVNIAISNNRDIYFFPEQAEEKAKLDNEIYIPEFECIAYHDDVELYKYSDYKYFVLEIEERYKEDSIL